MGRWWCDVDDDDYDLLSLSFTLVFAPVWVLVLALVFCYIIPTGRVDPLTVALGSLLADDVTFFCLALLLLLSFLTMMMMTCCICWCRLPCRLRLRFCYHREVKKIRHYLYFYYWITRRILFISVTIFLCSWFIFGLYNPLCIIFTDHKSTTYASFILLQSKHIIDMTLYLLLRIISLCPNNIFKISMILG